jgi:hypothetical protein
MLKTNLIFIGLLIALPVSMIPKGLLAAPPQKPQATATQTTKGALNVKIRGGRLSVEAQDVPLGTLLSSVTEQTGVSFNVSDGDLKQDRVKINIGDLPVTEAIPLMLIGYNTLNVLDERMKLLQVNVFSRAERNTAPAGARMSKPAASTERSAAVKESSTQKNHPQSAAPRDPVRIESALKDIRSDDIEQQQAALDDLVGGADARIAPAILDLALAEPTGNPATASGNPGSGDITGESREGNDLAFKAALTLWRHGLERGFADNETIKSLRVLEAQGNPITSDIAKRALEDMQAHF